MTRHVVFLAVILGTGIAAAAQQQGEIGGIVRNTSGAPVAGARIRIINQATRAEAIVYSGADGTYRAVDLEPQYYTVEAFRDGSSTVIRNDLNLAGGGRLRLDLELAPSAGLSMPAQGTLMFVILSGIVSALITLLFTEPGREALKRMWSAFEGAWDWCYGMLAPRFPNVIGLPGYRSRVHRSPVLGRIEHPVGPEDSEFTISLEQAFAPLAVLAGDSDNRTDLFAFASAHRRFLVLGGPGTGKTTLMKSLVMSILEKKCDETLNKLVPVFVVLREMATAGHTVEEAVVAALNGFRFKKAGKFVQSALDSGRLLIILDGLDEVGPNREAVSAKIRSFCNGDAQRSNPNSLIVTCRENSYRTRNLADVIPTITRIEPFSPQHMWTFLSGWPAYRGRIALKLYGEIQKDSQIRDICRNPLLLTILTGLYLAKDKFDLPSTREAFYQTAIDELLVQRPARRDVKQEFTDETKWKILQRVALDRIQTLSTKEDPEVLKRERLNDFAKEVLGNTLTEEKFQRLLDEMNEVNSIIKATGDGGFVLGHRTFQEYLAAREAHRTLKSSKVIALCGARPELTEVLCFYSGLVKSIPDTEELFGALVQLADPIVTGKCLLFVTEMPQQQHIKWVVDHLLNSVRSTQPSAAELDVLASLARRPEPVFEIARTAFTSAIEVMIQADDNSASGLVSALAASPERAMGVIPTLLAQSSVKHRVRAVFLLHDIGTPDALDELVRLIQNGGEPERGLAAALTASLIRTRNAELKRRAILFSERKPNPRIWPFEAYFPGRIAIPIIEAVQTEHAAYPHIGNKCIYEAVIRKDGPKPSRSDQRQWERVQAYIAANAYRKRGLHMLRRVASAALAVFAVLCLGSYVWCSIKNTVILAEVWPLRVTTVDAGPMVDAAEAADNLLREIKNHYPARVRGVRRLLPWNWRFEPEVSTAGLQTYDALERLSNFQLSASMAPWPTIDKGLAEMAAFDAKTNFLQRAAIARHSSPPISSPVHFWIFGMNRSNWRLESIVYVIFAVFGAGSMIVRFTRNRGSRTLAVDVSKMLSQYMLSIAVWFLMASILLKTTWQELKVFSALVALLVSFAISMSPVILQLFSNVEFPRNKYIKLTARLAPSSPLEDHDVEDGTFI
jgi:hypothetical protein